jgi:hypothetical protein
MTRRTTGGGRFDPKARHQYFLAGGGGPLTFGARCTDSILIAVNEVKSTGQQAVVERLMADGKRVFLDSGVFALAMGFARERGLRFDEVMATDPATMPGFADLFDLYVDLVRRWEDRLWGYVELDFGGMAFKRRTRQKLEAMGLRPIPVYHPLADGWAYFDELAAGYDRVCLANISQADRATRLRLVATVLHRKRDDPDLWVHALGLTPNEHIYAYHIDSADSSTWLTGVRWGAPVDRASGASLGPVDDEFKYQLGAPGDAPNGHNKGWMLGAYLAEMGTRNWRQHVAACEAEGLGGLS